MPKYKVLKSVAHNLGHSFLSDMNTVDRFKTFIPQVLRDIAEEKGVATVEVDFMERSVSPAVFRRPDTEEAVGVYHDKLRRLVNDQGASWSMIDKARLRLQFDLAHSHTAEGSRSRRPEFICEVEIVDDRGKIHVGAPQNWWNDPLGVRMHP